MQTLAAIPKGTTHIRVSEKTCYDGNKRTFTDYYRLTPFKFNDGTDGTRLEYFNYDFESWQGCVNSYSEVFNLIATNDKTITAIN